MTKISGGFAARHIGVQAGDIQKIVNFLGQNSLDSMIDKIVPKNIRLKRELQLPEPLGEHESLENLSEIMNENTYMRNYQGLGSYNTLVPPVILRNFFENPGWYTSYTPYQAEISQGRLELLFNYQTMITELTGLDISNASLLDEATAVAEAAGLAYRFHKGERQEICVLNDINPQSLAVLQTRMGVIGVKITDSITPQTAAVVVAYHDMFGAQHTQGKNLKIARDNGSLVIMINDLLALCYGESARDAGANISVGSAQRFGVPMGYGGPSAAFMAVDNNLARLMPGRIVGQSIDADGRVGFRLALQTREQHIRREKATSNICTAQALLANMSTLYAIWHQRDGLQDIASHCHWLAESFALNMKKFGLKLVSDNFFDTVTIVGPKVKKLYKICLQYNILPTLIGDKLIFAFDETHNQSDIELFNAIMDEELGNYMAQMTKKPTPTRTDKFLSQPFFTMVHSETDMMRLLRKLMDRDLALDKTMIPLGSCTMKLNAAAEMIPVGWDSVGGIHPFTPEKYTMGYNIMLDQLKEWLAEITGFDAISLQPNAGSQGEYAGLLAIMRYHRAHKQKNRNIVLIPQSAHGTNPASAQMVNMEVVVVACDNNGNVDLADLEAKAKLHSKNLAACMITYPSTHGVFETTITKAFAIVHKYGGLNYMDGANMNALVGLVRPADIGADVCHLNLHKTFCIPHGGGGPGMGPIGVVAKLAAYLPSNPLNKNSWAVSAHEFGSASILPITYQYIRMMGPQLAMASKCAILNANYIAQKLKPYYPLKFVGESGFVAHEVIIDVSKFKETAGVMVEDIAKRLIDYGFHAPTMSWPVHDSLMIEPTESESLAEMDRFIEAMVAIREEIARVERGEWPRDNNPLKHAPHPYSRIIANEWAHPYTRAEAIADGHFTLTDKYWSPVARIDNVYGDRNLICSCPPINSL